MLPWRHLGLFVVYKPYSTSTNKASVVYLLETLDGNALRSDFFSFFFSFFPSKDYIKMGTRLVPLGFTDCSAAPCWRTHPKRRRNCLDFSFSTFFYPVNLDKFDKDYTVRWMKPLSYGFLVACVDACVHTAACEQPLGTASERERERAAYRAGHRQSYRSVSSRFRDIDE